MMIEYETENKKLRIELLNKDLEISELRRSIEKLHCITLDAINATELLVSPTKQQSVRRDMTPSTDISMNLFDRYNENYPYDDDGDGNNDHRQQISSTRYLQDITDDNNDSRDNMIFHKSMEVAQLQQQLFNIHTEYAKNLSEFYNDKSSKESYINELEHHQAQLYQHVKNLERSNMELKVFITEINKESKCKEQVITSLMDELQSEREYNGHDDVSDDNDDDEDDGDGDDDDDDDDDGGDVDNDVVMDLDLVDKLVSSGPPNDDDSIVVDHSVWFNDLNPEDKEGDSGTISIDYAREEEEGDEVVEGEDAKRDGDVTVIIHHHDVIDHVNDVVHGDGDDIHADISRNSCDDGSTDANDYLTDAFVDSGVCIDGKFIEREVYIISNRSDREVYIDDDSGADREVRIDDDSGADREVRIDDDSGVDREACIDDDSGPDREVCIDDDSGADKEACNDDSGADREVCIDDDSGADRKVCIDDDSSASHNAALIDGIMSATFIVANDNSTIDGNISIYDSTINSSVSMEGTVLYNDGNALHTPNHLHHHPQQQQQQQSGEDIIILEKGGSIINILPPSEALIEQALTQQVDILTCDLQNTRRKVDELTETIAALERERCSRSFEHSDMLLFFIVLHLIMYFASVERFDVEDFIALCLYNAHLVVDKLQYLFPAGKKATLHFVFKQ